MSRSHFAFNKGDPVKVKDGVLCPDYKELFLAGWQGRVTDVRESHDGELLLDIVWDSVTLKAMLPAYIESREEKGLDWAEMSLLADEVDAVAARDSEWDVQAARKALEGRYAWFGLGQEGRRIHGVGGGVDPKDEEALFEAWQTHLKKNLQFPFTAKVAEYQEHPPLRHGDRVQVIRIVEVDDLVGLLVSVKQRDRELEFPLCDLEVVGKNNPNARPVKDYCVWFANR